MFFTTFVRSAVASLGGTTIPSDSRCAALDFVLDLYESPCHDGGCTDGSPVFRVSPCTRAAPPTPPESTTRYHFSLNATYEASDTLLASRQVPALDSGAVSAATVQVTIPGNAATGVYYLIASADADHAIAETTESNNRKTFKISVGADLQVADIDGPASAEAGGSLTAIDATKNAGGGPAAAGVIAGPFARLQRMHVVRRLVLFGRRADADIHELGLVLKRAGHGPSMRGRSFRTRIEDRADGRHN